MTIIRYVDIYKTEETPEGMVDSIALKDATLPISIEPLQVNSVQPYFNGKGKMFKNVSYLNYNGELLKVVGNFKSLRNEIDNYKPKRVEVKGYIRYGR